MPYFSSHFMRLLLALLLVAFFKMSISSFLTVNPGMPSAVLIVISNIEVNDLKLTVGSPSTNSITP